MYRITGCLLVFAGIQSYGQSQPLDQFYRIEEVITRELIKDIIKDQTGFIWLATDEGLIRFDGVNTISYSRQLPSQYTKGLITTSAGDLLILHDFGIGQVNSTPDNIEVTPLKIKGEPLPDTLKYPKSVFQDSRDNVWIGEDRSIIRISPDKAIRYLVSNEGDFISYNRSYSFAEDIFQQLWVATTNSHFYRYDSIRDQFVSFQPESQLSQISVISAFRGDILLIGGMEGLALLQVDSEGKVRREIFTDKIRNVSSIAVLDKTHLYIGTWDDGLYFVRINQMDQLEIQKVNEVLSDDIVSLHYTNGELWIASSESVGVLQRSRIKTIGDGELQRIESLHSFQGEIYYSEVGSLYKVFLNNNQWQIRELTTETTYIDRLRVTSNGLWLGDSQGGIYFYDLGNVHLETIQPPLQGHFPVLQITNTGNGDMWFTGNPNGLIRIDSSKRISQYTNVTNSAVVRENSKGEIFCGGRGKSNYFYRYEATSDEFVIADPQLDFELFDNFSIEDIGFTSVNDVLLATTQGLLKVNTGTGAYVGERIALEGIDPGELTKAIAVDSNGDAWVSHALGLVRLRGDMSILYNKASGLPSKTLKARGLELDDHGNLLIATARGIAYLKIQPQFNEKTATPFFTTIEINGENVNEIGSSGSYPYKSELKATFISLEYPGNKVVYQTRFSGSDSLWSEPSFSRSISILSFTPGNHDLQVRAKRLGGLLWSDPASFQFSISPPWFRSWWAYGLFALTTAGLVLFIVKIYNNRLIKLNERLEMLVKERTREINEQKEEIINQKNVIIEKKQELIEKNQAFLESQDALNKAEINFRALKEKQLQEQIEFKDKQITTHTLKIIQKNEMLRGLKAKLEDLVTNSKGGSISELKRSLRMIDESFRLDKDWEEFQLYFEQIYTGFYAKLKINYPELSTQELRHCALMRLNLTIPECGSILGISPDSVKVSRARIRKKLSLSSQQTLLDFIIGV